MPRPRASATSSRPMPGRTMQAELEALDKALGTPERPVVAIVGGAKVSTKLDLLENLITKVQGLVIGGAMANTFLHAQGMSVGKSLVEKDLADTARRILAKAERASCGDHPAGGRHRGAAFRGQCASQAYGVDAIPARRHDARRRPAVDRAGQGRDRRRRRPWSGTGRSAPSRCSPSTAARSRSPGTPPHGPRPASSFRVAGGGDTVAALNAAGVADDLPMCPQPAARSWNGWKARPCRASRC